jgi:hypothetical protein
MTQMLAITRHAVNDITGKYPDDSEVWKATHTKLEHTGPEYQTLNIEKGAQNVR